MGNSVWTCNYCNFINYGDHEQCVKCQGFKIDQEMAGIGLMGSGGQVVKDLTTLIKAKNPLKSLDVEKSAVVRMKINQRAKQLFPFYSNVIDNFYNNEGYVDCEFPPTKQSLYINGTKMKRGNLLHSDGFKHVKKWLRPHEINVSLKEAHYQISLFNDPSPRDVIQGELGSCWFLSALALLVEKPLLLLNCMVSQFYNINGYYQVRLCRRGEWIVVNIDDYLPCDKNDELVFAFGKKRQFWVPLMEKALAKLYGSYEAIARGACADGLQTLTGEPSEVLYLQTLSETAAAPNINPLNNMSAGMNNSFDLWKKILFSRNMGYLMTCLCHNDKLKFDAFHTVGLLHTHIYSILDVREFNNGNGMPIRLLRLRNPWGHKEFKGDWSNGWPYWPEHLKTQVNVNIKNDGCFWISFDDVLKYFYDITISKIRTDWTESRHSSFFYDYSSQAEVYMITVVQPGLSEFEIELFATGRKNQMFDRNADPDIDLCLIICRINDPTAVGGLNGLTCVAFEHSVEYYINLSASLTPGTYIVFATSIKGISACLKDMPKDDLINDCNTSNNTSNINSNNNNEPNYYSYNIVFHCQSSFTLNRTLLPADIVSDLFYSVGLTSNRVKYELNGNVRTIVISRSCVHAVIVENLSSSYCIKVSLNISNSKNIESTRVGSNTDDYLNPRQKQLITFLTPLNYRKSFVIGYKLDTQINAYFASGSQPEIPLSYSGLHAIKNF